MYLSHDVEGAGQHLDPTQGQGQILLFFFVNASAPLLLGIATSNVAGA